MIQIVNFWEIVKNRSKLSLISSIVAPPKFEDPLDSQIFLWELLAKKIES